MNIPLHVRCLLISVLIFIITYERISSEVTVNQKKNKKIKKNEVLNNDIKLTYMKMKKQNKLLKIEIYKT